MLTTEINLLHFEGYFYNLFMIGVTSLKGLQGLLHVFVTKCILAKVRMIQSQLLSLAFIVNRSPNLCSLIVTGESYMQGSFFSA